MKAAGWILALVAVGSLAAPDGSAAQTIVGTKGGVSFSTTAVEGFGSRHTAAPVLSGFVRLPVHDRVAVQAEALWAMRSFSTTGFLFEGSSVRIRYLDLPVLVVVRALESRTRVRPYVTAGVFWATELACSTAGGIVEVEGDDGCDGRFSGRGTADVGFILGGAVEADVSPRTFLTVDGRFHLGMRNLHLDPTTDSARSRAWSVMGGVGVRLGGGRARP